MTPACNAAGCGRPLQSEAECGRGLCAACWPEGGVCALCGAPAVIVWQVESDGILDAEARCWDCRGKRRAA